ncbi:MULTISPECIES: thermonuclease family protein [Cytobacillus]|uniref:TNase-like domain-containing protein n=1 Tax=Cytobacillus oceanisediminis TaxID=665099 RepID=A0ABX3CNH7_9BACI|nr:hypothetical protein HMPREF1013_04781 [Bacillus sp. 2_A_57_CT2]OHX45038.1 hypothetical protein BBV17_24245 [Cytobacillus oceanisediminis]
MPFAEDARDRLNELVAEKEIILELGKGDSRDKYNRLLSYGFLKTGESIQEIMLEEGLLVVRYIYKRYKISGRVQSCYGLCKNKQNWNLVHSRVCRI